MVQEIIDQEGVHCVQVSCHSEEGVMELKNKACDALLAHRVDNKMKGTKVNSIINRIHVAQPKPRDDLVRAPFIPEAVKERKQYDKNDPERRKLQRDIEAEEGGAGVFNINLKRKTFEISEISILIQLHNFQRTIFLLIPNGSSTLYLKSWTARTSPTSSTQTLLRNSRHLNAKKKNSKLKDSMTVNQTLYVPLSAYSTISTDLLYF